MVHNASSLIRGEGATIVDAGRAAFSQWQKQVFKQIYKIGEWRMSSINLWQLIDPTATLETLGFLPVIFDPRDEAPARDQAADRYAHGGGWRPQKRWTLDTATLIARYPGDEPYKPLAKLQLRDETIVLYPSSWVAIIQSDGSYEISRMD